MLISEAPRHTATAVNATALPAAVEQLFQNANFILIILKKSV